MVILGKIGAKTTVQKQDIIITIRLPQLSVTRFPLPTRTALASTKLGC